VFLKREATWEALLATRLGVSKVLPVWDVLTHLPAPCIAPVLGF